MKKRRVAKGTRRPPSPPAAGGNAIRTAAQRKARRATAACLPVARCASTGAPASTGNNAHSLDGPFGWRHSNASTLKKKCRHLPALPRPAHRRIRGTAHHTAPRGPLCGLLRHEEAAPTFHSLCRSMLVEAMSPRKGPLPGQHCVSSASPRWLRQSGASLPQLAQK